MNRLYATAAMGTEPALRDELRALRLRGVRADRGGVHFEGSFSDAMTACFHSRVAQRVLLEMGSFEAPDEDSLYDGVRNIGWTDHITPATSMAVRSSSQKSALSHTQFLSQLVKDAVVDQIRQRTGARPDVDRQDPDVQLSLHLAKDQATLYLDLAGSALFARGYRLRHDGAPLKETLAAAIVILSGWDRQQPLCDPMCGSGTLAIEGALIARNEAPGLSRKTPFGFERWASFDESGKRSLREIRERAKAMVKSDELPDIIARDVAPSSVDLTRENAARAGVSIGVELADISEPFPKSPIKLVVNPPYGERLSLTKEMLQSFGRSIAGAVKNGSYATVLSGSPELTDAVRARPSKLVKIMNGDIECRLASYGERPGT